MTRREALGILAVGTGAAAIAACAPGTTTGPTGAAPDKPRRGGTLRLASQNDLRNLEIFERVQSSIDIKYQTSDTLTQLDADKDFQPQPRLAESWEYSSDSKRLKFNLRKGVTWHTGREFTSADVKYSLFRPRDPKLTNITTQFLTWSNLIKDIETPDKNTAILVFEKPRVGIFDALDDWNMVDQQTLESPKGQTTIVGTGAFKFVEWANAVSVKLERNPSWWGGAADGRPYLDKIEVSIMSDPQAMTVALEAGSIDAITVPLLRDGVRLQKDANYKFITNPKSGQIHNFTMNVTKSPTSNIKIRQAVQYAYDRKRCVENVMLGLGSRSVLPWTPGTLAYDQKRNDSYQYDLDKARSLVRESGLAGAEILISIDNTRADTIQFGQILADDLNKAGLKAVFQSLQPQQITQMQRDKAHNITMSGGAFGNLEASTQMLYQNPGRNTSHYYNDDKRYNDLVDQSSSEPDKAKRKALYDQMSDIMLESAHYTLTAHRFPTWLTSKKVSGAKFRTTENVVLADVWLAE